MTAQAEHIAALEARLATLAADNRRLRGLLHGGCGDVDREAVAGVLRKSGADYPWMLAADLEPLLAAIRASATAAADADNRRLRTKAANLSREVRQLRAMRDAGVAWVPLVTFGEKHGCGT